MSSAALAGRTNRVPIEIVQLRSVDRIDTRIDNLECAAEFRTVARFYRFGLRGFAAPLSETQAARVVRSLDVSNRWRDPSRYVVQLLLAPRSPEVGPTISALERTLRFAADYRYAGAAKGFAATLGWQQVEALDRSPLVARTVPEGANYLAFYIGQPSPQEVDLWTDDLEHRYGFTATMRFRGLGGFAASLTAQQLAGIDREPRVDVVTGMGSEATLSTPEHGPPELPQCRVATSFVRRDLRRAFIRAHPAGSPGPIGRVYYARFAGRDWAIARFGERLEKFGRPARGVATSSPRAGDEGRMLRPAPWRDLGSVTTPLCPASLPTAVLRVWLLPELGDGCFGVE